MERMDVMFMGFTFAEKIIGRKAGHIVKANDCIVVDVDVMMASDTTGPMTIQAFREMGGKKLAKPKSTFFVIDHATPCHN